MNFCERQNTALLDRGLSCDDISDFWRYWRQAGGQMTADIQPIISKLTFCAADLDGGASPPFVFIGDNAYVTRCYGAAWSRDALAKRRATPDDNLERLAAEGYAEAIAGEARYDVVSARTISDMFGEIDIAYERLILPLTTATGHRLLGCMTAPIRPIRQLSVPDSADPRTYSKAASHHGGYAWAAFATKCQ